MTAMKTLSVLAAAAGLAQAIDLSGLTGSVNIRDWDCKASPYSPVEVCDVEDNPISIDGEDVPAFTCSQQHSYAKNTSLAYGFATVVSGGIDAQILGACYKLTYDVAANVSGSAELSTKTLVVQATNVTRGVGEALFDLSIPGAGVGPFSQQACVEQYSAAPAGYGRCETKADCEKLPQLLQAACRFRFDWISDLAHQKRDIGDLTTTASGALGAKVDYSRVKCPSELVAKSKFVLPDDDSFPTPPGSNPVESEETIVPTADFSHEEYVAPVEDDDTSSSGYFKRDGPPQQEFAQCGGQGYAGPRECDQGLSCKDQSIYYSQCMRDVQILYGQCGGQGFNGPSECVEGLKCNYVHAKYSQCQPAPSTRSVSSPPSPVEARDSAQTVYGQCSGSNWKGATECATGLKCFVRDSTYGQCLQTLQLKFEQCGGTLFVGPSLCVAGASCKKIRSDYSQCLPDDDSNTEVQANIDPVHGRLDRDPKHVATAADGTGNEDKDSMEDEDTPTVTDGVTGSAVANIAAPRAIIAIAVLGTLFL